MQHMSIECHSDNNKWLYGWQISVTRTRRRQIIKALVPISCVKCRFIEGYPGPRGFLSPQREYQATDKEAVFSIFSLFTTLRFAYRRFSGIQGRRRKHFSDCLFVSMRHFVIITSGSQTMSSLRRCCSEYTTRWAWGLNPIYLKRSQITL